MVSLYGLEGLVFRVMCEGSGNRAAGRHHDPIFAT